MLVRYARDCVIEFPGEFSALGFAGTFRGHDELLEMTGSFDEAFEERVLHPAFLVDLGDRVLTLGRLQLPGTASGLEFEREFAQLITLRGGLVVRELEFLSWDQALAAADLDPDIVALPRRVTERGVQPGDEGSRSRA